MNEISNVKSSKLHIDSQRVLPYLLKLNAEEQVMILSDFAKSKRLTWNCP
jgi:hypothetical protein